MRHFGSDRAPTAGAARVTRTSQCRWTARLRVGLALLDQESRWWRRRQLWSLLQNAAEVRWHRSFDNRACRTTLRETGHFTAADVHQPYFRRSPYEGLVFILSLLFTVDATHVSSLFVGREPQNRGSLVRRRRLDVPGLAHSPTTWSSTFPRRFHRRRRTPPARSGAHRAVPHRRLLRTGSGLPRASDPVAVSRPGHGRAEPPPSANGCDLYRRITHDGRDGRQPTVPARTCTPIATRCGRSRWPSGPWTARSAARTRSSASTSSRTLLLRTSGLRSVPETPGSPERAVKGGAATT